MWGVVAAVGGARTVGGRMERLQPVSGFICGPLAGLGMWGSVLAALPSPGGQTSPEMVGRTKLGRPCQVPALNSGRRAPWERGGGLPGWRLHGGAPG